MTNERARKVLQELWRHERTDYHSLEVQEALDRAIRTLGSEVDKSGVYNRPQHNNS